MIECFPDGCGCSVLAPAEGKINAHLQRYGDGVVNGVGGKGRILAASAVALYHQKGERPTHTTSYRQTGGGFWIRNVESQAVQDSVSGKQAKGKFLAQALRRRAHMVDSSDKMHDGGGPVVLHAFADSTGCRPRWGSSQPAYSTYNLAIASSKYFLTLLATIHICNTIREKSKSKISLGTYCT